MAGKGKPKTGGRQKGTPNKLNAALKEMILQAAEAAHPEGTVGYLKLQAMDNPSAFLSLLGKVLPMTVLGAGDNGEHIVATVERRIVRPKD